MRKKFKDFYKAQWLFVRGFLVVYTVGIIVFIAFEIPDAISENSSESLVNIGMGVAMIAGSFVLAWFGRHWLNFLAGEEICCWRYRQ